MTRIGALEFLTDFRTGGTERQVTNLAVGLDRSRFAVHVGCFRRLGQFLEEVEACGLPVTSYGIGRLFGGRAVVQQWKLGRYIRRHRIDVVHSFGFYANVFAIPAARMAGARVVMAAIRDTGDHLTSLQRRVQRWVCGLADCVVANADAVRGRLLAEGYDPRRVVVIRNGITLDRFAVRRPSGELRAELGLPPGQPVVAVLSRLVEGKGVDCFLEAAAMVARRFENVRFLVVGDCAPQGSTPGPYRAALQRYAGLLGLGERVVFTGFRSDIPELLSLATVSVLPSLAEGLSNVLLESMAAGVPVVATRVGGTPEAVVDGVTGFLVPPRDPGALAKAMARLLEDPALVARLGENGRRRTVERFSLEGMVRETEDLYRRLLGGGARQAA